MAKRIERSRIESGRIELPRKLAFLIEQGVDFISLTERDGNYTVELSADALKKLVKAKADLKALKTDQKKAVSEQMAALDAEKAAHEEARATLAKAERRVKALEKKLAAAPEQASAPSARGRKSEGRRQAVEAGSEIQEVAIAAE
jgi:predicted  nucleic acid-binding Zn-ribbon protein